MLSFRKKMDITIDLNGNFVVICCLLVNAAETFTGILKHYYNQINGHLQNVFAKELTTLIHVYDQCGLF